MKKMKPCLACQIPVSPVPLPFPYQSSVFRQGAAGAVNKSPGRPTACQSLTLGLSDIQGSVIKVDSGCLANARRGRGRAKKIDLVFTFVIFVCPVPGALASWPRLHNPGVGCVRRFTPREFHLCSL